MVSATKGVEKPSVCQNVSQRDNAVDALMRLFLLRHGIAENGRPGAPDSERALTGEGRKKLRDVLAVAKAAGVAPDLIVTSPYKRALQTAEVAAEVLKYPGELVRSEVLIPDSTPADVWSEVRAYKEFGAVMLVSHEPLLGCLFSYLLRSNIPLVDFKKGALARIDMEGLGPQPRGILRWLLPPKLAGD